jgi:flagellar hook protein FlgE
MFTSFSTALSALNAASSAVNIVGNNLANLNTTGFKAEVVQFSDLMSESLGIGASASQGLGVGPAHGIRRFAQGSIQQTTGSFDAAIKGNGFFVVRNSNNQTLFTRAGSFGLDSNGRLQTASGETVQGWTAVGGVFSPNGPVGDIAIPLNGVSPAVTTKTLSISANLNAQGTVGETNGEYSTPVQVVDPQGGVHTLTMKFTKTAANAWNYSVTIPDAEINEGGDPELASGSLEFDGAGIMTSPKEADGQIPIAISGLKGGAADFTVNWNLFSNHEPLVSQFAESSSVSALNQDGRPAGQITSLGLADGGLIIASFSNGTQATVAQIALAGITNPETLAGAGNNNLRLTANSSEPAIGAANTGGLGSIAGQSLEGSTVDIATEFTNLISYQRTYQANSRIISTSDQMAQDVIGLIR